MTDTARLGFRVWRGPGVLAATIGWLLVSVWNRAPIQIPARDVADYLTPLAPLPLVAAFAASRQPLHAWTGELTHPRRIRRRFVHTLAFAGLAATLAVTAPLLGSTAGAAVLLRNYLLFIGIVMLVPSRHDSVALACVILYGAACWLIGSRGPNIQPDRWVIPFRHPGDIAAIMVTTATFTGGLACWVKERPSSSSWP